jgi:type II secretory pathway component PulC
VDLRRRIAAVFVAVTVVSAALAGGVNLVLGRLLATPDASSVGGAAIADAGRTVTPPRPRALPLETYLDGIMSRNLFDVNVIASWRPARAGEGGLVSSDLRVKLLGTIVADPDIYSSALIVDETAPDYARGYSLGDMLHDREIAAIEPRRVKLRAPDGAEEWLVVDAEGLTAAAPEPTGSEEPTAEGITQVGENKFQISRDVFDKNINDLESISRMGRALLHRGPDGEFDGYRLSSIRRGSLAEQIGIKNGDVIHSVNGEPLTSVQAAMNAYNTMKGQSQFCLEVSRRGSPTELCYDVN